ncbi:hypothetical protein M422DRAFT_150184 [Sphaerobolus stellatus SS14]|nr:hypothetical protein M422DRAFT_150184 [Sphaerobolus stellatus SS14]
MLTGRGRIILSLLIASCSIFFLSVLFSDALREKIKVYAAYPSPFRRPAESHPLQTDTKVTVSNLCLPDDFAAGSWSKRPAAVAVEGNDEALLASGFQGCASWLDHAWHLGLANRQGGEIEGFPWVEWRGNVSSYDWIPGQHCQASYEKINKENLVKQLVEDGGWLLLGDSTSEGHLNSLSCTLYPHVRFDIPFPGDDDYLNRALPQSLYLKKDSPLISQLKFPEGFDIDKTPLAVYKRTDLLLGKSEIDELWRKFPGRDLSRDSLFEDNSEAVWDIDASVYLPLFISPLPEANFRTMIFATGGHWTVGTIPGLHNVSDTESFGYSAMRDFFAFAIEAWTEKMAEFLEKTKKEDTAKGIVRQKERHMLVRGYTPGHDNCNDPKTRLGGPKLEVGEWMFKPYNWSWILKFNEAFEKVVKRLKHPNVHYLPLEKLAVPRPDAHVTSDCLHVMTGSGIMENWSEYISYYLFQLP